MITTTTNTNINNNNNINIIMMRKKEFKNGKFEKLSTKRQTKRKRPKCEPNSDVGSKNGLEKFWTKAGFKLGVPSTPLLDACENF